jgi:hypothetical protein
METVVCDAGGLGADVRAVDVLARLHLLARRRGCELRVERASDELQQLLGFVGLGGVLRVEPRRQAEEREQRLRVEEERELDDPPL